ncbi:MAG: hypothetical protein K9N23_21725 [Akkermansiaceae bacterium]|nr:hypothetical protein [Akkermansiaceae bacterium]
MSHPPPPITNRPAPVSERPIGTFLAGVALVLVVFSHLIWSSPEYRQQHLLLGSLLALLAFTPVFWPVLRNSGGPGWTFVTGLMLAHAACWVGGVFHGTGLLAATTATAQGLIGVAGLAVITTVLLDARWHRYAKWTAFSVLTVLTLGSLIGYFISIERYIVLGGYAEYFSPVRIALIWPTRMLTAGFGQISWDNTNYAAYGFALAFVLILESLAKPTSGRRWLRWCWCGLLCTLVFLTASRNGGLMIALALPVILIRRPLRFTATTLLVMAAGGAIGYAALQTKLSMIPAPPPPAATPGKAKPLVPPKPKPKPVRPPPTAAAHSSEYLQRASAGRTLAYRLLWEDLEGARCCGTGLAAAGKPVLFRRKPPFYLTHEHSSFMATLRCGGLLALAGHALVLLAATWCALRLLRRGLRWPAVLMAAALGGLLFDRSTVLGLTGNYEFISHWVAVLIPLVLASQPNSPPPGNPDDGSKL